MFPLDRWTTDDIEAAYYKKIGKIFQASGENRLDSTKDLCRFFCNQSSKRQLYGSVRIFSSGCEIFSDVNVFYYDKYQHTLNPVLREFSPFDSDVFSWLMSITVSNIRNENMFQLDGLWWMLEYFNDEEHLKIDDAFHQNADVIVDIFGHVINSSLFKNGISMEKSPVLPLHRKMGTVRRELMG